MWREPTDHANGCYFCLTPPIQRGISRKKKRSVVYPDVATVSRPVPHGINLPGPRHPEEYQQDSEGEINSIKVDYNEPTTSQLSQFVGDNIVCDETLRISQDELSDLIGDLNWPKDKIKDK
ncbi:hypothetical protein EVAR_88131_1 [Eumeta japonica]|uniref:Uncharacterized protein n=1 Tax=Eumeta variegata TaxID=151549 RepID=A0A4C1WSZ8_EUMVA|nr:hypothetical protein EVAR_88131_1 [Eumeta japonica]